MQELNKHEMYLEGTYLMNEFCDTNKIKRPEIYLGRKHEWAYPKTCAYYRKDQINICVPLCAQQGNTNRAWSYPGYIVDRTPYGVIQHELGHHYDYHRGNKSRLYFSDFSKKMMDETGEKPITSYAPNHAEWFAEIFRLFVTNPDLLKRIRPKSYHYLIEDGLKPIIQLTWVDVLIKNEAGDRYIMASSRKIKKL